MSEPTSRDPFALRRRSYAWPDQALVTAVVAVGGAAGASARYGAALVWPTAAGRFPWTTLAVNVTGCALIGILMATITEVPTVHRLLRPLLGTGVLGGYTTFSTFTAEVEDLVSAGHAADALVYLTITPVTALLATWTIATLTRRLLN
jgi:CrcB protein